LDAAAVGLGFEVLVFVTLKLESMDDFDQALAAVPNVVEAQRLFGEPDYLLRMVTADHRSTPANHPARSTGLSEAGYRRRWVSATLQIGDSSGR
jgi:hypothetical protein